MLEFSLIALPILLLCLLSIELVHWNTVRQHLDFALYQSLRTGITQHANPQEIVKQFHYIMSALPTNSTQHTKHYAWLIRRSPTEQDYTRYHQSKLQALVQTPYRIMDNDYLAEQSANNDNLLQAHTLTLELYYSHQTLTPGLEQLLRYLSKKMPFNSPIKQKIMSQGKLVLTHKLSLPMQSHPIEWPDFYKDGVSMQSLDHTDLVPSQAQEASACLHWWCRSDPLAINKTPTLPVLKPPQTPPVNTENPNPSKEPPPSKEEGLSKPSDSEQANKPTDQGPECGVTVCCL